MLAVSFKNRYAPSPGHRVSVFLDRLNEPSNCIDILINIFAHCDQRPIQHCFGCKMSGPRIGHVNGHVELPQRSPPCFNRLPPRAASNLTFLEDCDDSWFALWQWNSGILATAKSHRPPPRTGDLARRHRQRSVGCGTAPERIPLEVAGLTEAHVIFPDAIAESLRPLCPIESPSLSSIEYSHHSEFT